MNDIFYYMYQAVDEIIFGLWMLFVSWNQLKMIKILNKIEKK